MATATAAYDRSRHALPDGHDTLLDDETTNLSMGERQLTTPARAFLANPRILTLDEATSSVDTRTEPLIQRAMSRLREDQTPFVIAHRLSTIRDTDLIFQMKSGSIVEQGSNDELLATKGAYWRLYNTQFEGAAEDEELVAVTAAPLPPPSPRTPWSTALVCEDGGKGPLCIGREDTACPRFPPSLSPSRCPVACWSSRGLP